ncbi:uncharacterized protein LOC117121110 [Anneissia japonica]|uniref:uncharacterized protein LOC117121110 n=1 Tax=Anneissia japonica TaxID=1529436 RepID=UPI0014257D1B|nr:uncharacterized protein LOC117121110 [Anneissia japonica]
MPFRQADHLTDVMKRMFPDSEIAKKLTMKRTKASYVMQDGIASHEVDSLAEICRTQKFSLLIDESTDVSVTQILAVVVRFFHKRKVTDALLAAVEVEDGSAESLYAAVRSQFR